SVAALYALQKSMMLMPCGPSAVPTGGAGVAAPAWIWILTIAATRRFAISIRSLSACRDTRPADVRSLASSLALARSPQAFQLGDVGELELDRRLATEDVHEHLELRAVDVDLADDAVEVGERTGDDPHLLGHLVLEPRPHLLLGGRAFDLLAGAEDVFDLTT